MKCDDCGVEVRRNNNLGIIINLTHNELVLCNKCFEPFMVQLLKVSKPHLVNELKRRRLR